MVSYPVTKTFTGDGSATSAYIGLDPDGSYKTSPSSFSIPSWMRIEADIVKEYGCSDHFVIFASSSTYRPWTWGSETGVLKIVWNCDHLNIEGPHTSTSTSSSTLSKHNLKIYYTQSNVRVTSQLDSVDFSLSGSYWLSPVYIWIGADDDDNRGSDFTKLDIYYQ